MVKDQVVVDVAVGQALHVMASLVACSHGLGRKPLAETTASFRGDGLMGVLEQVLHKGPQDTAGMATLICLTSSNPALQPDNYNLHLTPRFLSLLA